MFTILDKYASPQNGIDRRTLGLALEAGRGASVCFAGSVVGAVAALGVSSLAVCCRAVDAG